MELTPQRLREVEFKERWRGYDPEEVDDLLERVAAGIEDIESRVRQATERAARAEREASGSTETDETLRRTLVLAQRTADAAIADANERATALVAEAEQRAASVISEAEAEARRITEETEKRLRDNVSSLESARTTLQDDVDALGRHLAAERERVRATLQKLIEQVDGDLQSAAAPAVREVEIPEQQTEPEPEPATGADETPDGVEAAAEGDEADDEGEPTQAHDVLAAADDTADDEPELVLSGPGREIDTGDDAFFAQLRGALEDDAPLGPRDDEPVSHRVGSSGPALFDQEGSDEGRLGPFLRRKRRDT
jgi:DivIVA domain-containing protein